MSIPTGGMHIALLGIDGVGKTTLAVELEELGRQAGKPVHIVSWRRSIQGGAAGDERPYPLPSLDALWLETFRLFLGGSSVDLSTLESLATSTGGPKGRGYLHDESLAVIRPSGPFAAAWVELAGNVLLHHEVVRPLVEQGSVVVHESFGYKHLVKELLLCARLSPNWQQAADAAQSFVRHLFGTSLRPDLGIYLATDPRTALKWRVRQRGHIGAFDSFAAGGESPDNEFVWLQSECAREFDGFARDYGWLRIDIQDAPRPVNRALIRDRLETSALASLVRHSQAAEA